MTHYTSMTSTDQQPTSRQEEKYDQDNSPLNSNELTNIEENDENIEKLSKFTKLIAPLYLFTALIALILTIIAAVTSSKGQNIKYFWGFLLFILTLAGAYFGGWGVYKWGTVEEQIEKLHKNNEEYKDEISTLKETKNELQQNVDEIQASTDRLQQDVDTLDEQLKEFDELKNSLQDLVGDNEDINNMINNINNMYGDMRGLMLENEKSKLYEAYYDVQFQDDSEGLSKREYKRLYNKLPVKTREKLDKIGDFETLAGSDGVIDLKEFQDIVDQLLKDVDSELAEQLQKHG